MNRLTIYACMIHRGGKLFFTSLWILLLVILTACHPAVPIPSPSLPAFTLSPSPSVTPDVEIFPSITPIMPLVTGLPTLAPIVELASPMPDPLRFVFPTPAPPAVSAWRPALYPIPWALTLYDHFYFTRPIAANDINWPVADYRYGGVFFDGIVHSGVDIPTPIGTSVLAAGEGKVVWAGYGLYYGEEDITDPYGLAILIRHNFGFQGKQLLTVYGHLDSLFVIQGQHVEAGEEIGKSGQTGKVSGPHLHFEVRLGESDFFSTRNPELWLVPPQGWGVMAGRVMNSGGLALEGLMVTIQSEGNNQTWWANSYGGEQVTSDEYYNENVVISDLPAGTYTVRIDYLGKSHTQELTIQPGLVSYFTFRGYYGIKIGFPPLPGDEFNPFP